MDAAEAAYQAVMDAYEKGRREAIQECHDAVAALEPESYVTDGAPYRMRGAALAAIAAIDALRATP